MGGDKASEFRPASVPEARRMVAGLLDWCDSGAGPELVNMNMVKACLRMVQTWLEAEPDLAAKLSKTHAAMTDAVRSSVDMEWLFDADGEPLVEAMSLAAFEVLMELRVLADRLDRAGVLA